MTEYQYMTGINTQLKFTKASQRQFNRAINNSQKYLRKSRPAIIREAAIQFILSIIKLTPPKTSGNKIPQKYFKRPSRTIKKKDESELYKKGYRYEITRWKNDDRTFIYASSKSDKEKKQKISYMGAAKNVWRHTIRTLKKMPIVSSNNRKNLYNVASKASLFINQSKKKTSPYMILGNDLDYIKKIAPFSVAQALRKAARGLQHKTLNVMKRKLERKFR